LIPTPHFMMNYYRIKKLKTIFTLNTIASIKTFRWVGFFFAISWLVSCNDELNDVGLEISPSSRVLIFHDSLTLLNSYTVAMEDLITTNPTNLILGYMIDTRLGVFQNNFMAEVKTLGRAVDFGENPVPDSVVLLLKYTSINGDTLTPQTISFYELNLEKELDVINGKPNSDATVNQYYNPDKFLGSFTFTPPDTVTVMRFKLPYSLAERLIDTANFKYYDTVVYFNWNVFRGIYAMAKPLTQGGGTCNFTYSDSTMVQLYYHNDSLETASYTYNINTTTKCNLFKRSLNPDINIVPYKTEPDSALQQNLCYVKSYNGCETRIDISGLKTWADSGYFAINKAFLTVYADYTDTIEEQTYPPMSLGIYQLGDSYSIDSVLDYYSYSTGQWGVVGYDTSINAYNIKLTQQLYSTIQEGKDTLSLVLTSSTNKTAPNRMILKGARDSDFPMELNITYTKINN
jgi:hypothetical protein